MTAPIMSNSLAATKVADQIISRLFDHRQFTSGEIIYIYKNLGEKADIDANFDRILKINQNASVIVDSYTEDLCKSSDNLTKNICDQVSSLKERTEKLLEIEKEKREREAHLLAEARNERERHREKSHRKTLEEIEKLKESLAKEELELERKYLQFEENLRKSIP